MRCDTLNEIDLEEKSGRHNVYTGVVDGKVVLCVAPEEGELGKYTMLEPSVALRIAACVVCCTFRAFSTKIRSL